ncbi:MAG TPA: enoyl-ACP reductase [Thermoanaerobaculia bacterium]|nr:enoyl-ACP reductase [Thermoanaerobaculia bacterium]
MSEARPQDTERPALRTSPGALLEGRRGLVVGVANERSIAWGVTRHAAEHGAQIALTFQGEALERRVRPLAERVGSLIVEPLDVTRPDQIEALFARIGEEWGALDFLVHSIAFADRDDLSGRTLDTSRDGFLKALEISAYSLISLARAAEPLMSSGGSVIAMTYLGSVKAVPNYNVMGIAKAALEATVRYLALDLGEKGVRVNAISAGPIKTLAAAGVSGLRSMLGQAADRSPLKRNVSTDDVGTAGLYLLSDLAAGVTGEIHYVDAGFNITAW